MKTSVKDDYKADKKVPESGYASCHHNFNDALFIYAKRILFWVDNGDDDADGLGEVGENYLATGTEKLAGSWQILFTQYLMN